VWGKRRSSPEKKEMLLGGAEIGFGKKKKRILRCPTSERGIIRKSKRKKVVKKER